MSRQIERVYASATTLAAGTFSEADIGRMFLQKAGGHVFRCVAATPKFKYEYTQGAGAEYVITYAASVTPNLLNGPLQSMTLTGALALAVPSDAAAVVGSRIRIRLIQGSGGTKVITFAAGYHFPGGAPTESTTAAYVDVLDAVYNGTVWNATLSVASATS